MQRTLLSFLLVTKFEILRLSESQQKIYSLPFDNPFLFLATEEKTHACANGQKPIFSCISSQYMNPQEYSLHHALILLGTFRLNC